LLICFGEIANVARVGALPWRNTKLFELIAVDITLVEGDLLGRRDPEAVATLNRNEVGRLRRYAVSRRPAFDQL